MQVFVLHPKVAGHRQNGAEEWRWHCLPFSWALYELTFIWNICFRIRETPPGSIQYGGLAASYKFHHRKTFYQYINQNIWNHKYIHLFDAGGTAVVKHSYCGVGKRAIAYGIRSHTHLINIKLTLPSSQLSVAGRIVSNKVMAKTNEGGEMPVTGKKRQKRMFRTWTLLWRFCCTVNKSTLTFRPCPSHKPPPWLSCKKKRNV